MRILVFQPTIVGHYLEYLHHLFRMANSDLGNEYIFVIHKEFEDKKHLFEWKITHNIMIDLLSESEYSSVVPSGNLLKDSYRMCKLTKYYANKHGCYTIFSANIVTYCPMAPFVLGCRYKLVGIIYKIYLYGDHLSSVFERCLNRIKYFTYSRFKIFSRLLILNDAKSAKALNDIYHTNKFKHIPDPFVPINTNKIINIKEKYSIPEDKKVFVHFGGLSKRKGTHIILDSIDYLSNEEALNYVFIIAGIVGDSIKESINFRIKELGKKTTIIFENRFCEYEYLAGLCQCCTALLIPYQQTDISSGLLGYASQFNKPVIGPNCGLIGELIAKYHLGICIDATSPKLLAEAYALVSKQTQTSDNRKYCHINNVENFITTIRKSLNNVVN